MERGFRIKLADEAQEKYNARIYGEIPFGALIFNAKKLVAANELAIHKMKGNAMVDEATVDEITLEKIAGMYAEYQKTRGMSKGEAMRAITEAQGTIEFLKGNNRDTSFTQVDKQMVGARNALKDILTTVEGIDVDVNYRSVVEAAQKAAQTAETTVVVALTLKATKMAKKIGDARSMPTNRKGLVERVRELVAMGGADAPVATGQYRQGGDPSNSRHFQREMQGWGKGGGGSYRR